MTLPSFPRPVPRGPARTFSPSLSHNFHFYGRGFTGGGVHFRFSASIISEIGSLENWSKTVELRNNSKSQSRQIQDFQVTDGGSGITTSGTKKRNSMTSRGVTNQFTLRQYNFNFLIPGFSKILTRIRPIKSFPNALILIFFLIISEASEI